MEFNTNFRKPDCRKCLDIGMVELSCTATKVLAKCACDAGKLIYWKLPTAPMKGFAEQPLDAEPFKANPVAMVGHILALAKTSEEFWVSLEQTKKAQANALADF